MKEVEILKSALVYCQVCADKSLSLSAVTDIVNRENPTGIQSDWSIAYRNLAGNDVGPVDCAEDSARRHYVFGC